MRFKNYINESSIKSIGKSLLMSIKNLSYDKARKLFKDNFNKFIKIIKDNGLEQQFLEILNKKTNKKISSLSSLINLNENILNEDAKHFWGLFKMEGWPAISVFPALSLWFEFDKLVEGAGLDSLDIKKIMIYATIWLVLILSKHISGWKKWKKEFPDEYEKEGKPGPLTFKR
jgi:hypothetical protein